MKLKYVIEIEEELSDDSANQLKESGITESVDILKYMESIGYTFEEYLREQVSYFADKQFKVIEYRIEE